MFSVSRAPGLHFKSASQTEICVPGSYIQMAKSLDSRGQMMSEITWGQQFPRRDSRWPLRGAHVTHNQPLTLQSKVFLWTPFPTRAGVCSSGALHGQRVAWSIWVLTGSLLCPPHPMKRWPLSMCRATPRQKYQGSNHWSWLPQIKDENISESLPIITYKSLLFLWFSL